MSSTSPVNLSKQYTFQFVAVTMSMSPTTSGDVTSYPWPLVIMKLHTTSPVNLLRQYTQGFPSAPELP